MCSPAQLHGGNANSEIDDEVREEDAVFSEPIIGKKPRPPADGVKGLPVPKEMTPAQVAEHCLSHLPRHDGCPYCTAARRANSHHRSLPPSDRSIPLLHADYGFLKAKDESVTPFLGGRIHPWKIVFALLCSIKGPDARVTRRIAQLIKDTGLTHFGYKPGREASIRSLLCEAVSGFTIFSACRCFLIFGIFFFFFCWLVGMAADTVCRIASSLSSSSSLSLSSVSNLYLLWVAIGAGAAQTGICASKMAQPQDLTGAEPSDSSSVSLEGCVLGSLGLSS